MHYKFFNNSQKSWKVMYEAILVAEKSIFLEMYIFQNDMPDYNFFEILKQKAQKGIIVKIVLDSYGSLGLSRKEVSELREAGVELLFLSYFLHRTHRKVLIIDENIAFIGGVNFHQSASLWNDLVVRVNGKLVSRITKSFAKVYFECGGSDSSILIYKEKSFKNKLKDWLIENIPVSHKYNLIYTYKENLTKAKKSIVLITPYFMPKRWFIGLLHQAVLRGVKVEILVPKNTDYYIIDRVNYFFLYKLSSLGADIYLENKMNHAKAMIIDNKEGIVGSHNLDYLSFELNSEIGIFFTDLKAVKEIMNIAEKWKKEAILFDYKKQKPIILDYLLSPIIRIFNKIF